jgi:hypothetical protein
MPASISTWNSDSPVRIAGSISGERNSVVSSRAPGRLPRAIASAHSAPITVESTTTIPATRSESHSAFMNSALVKNFTNQRRLTPTGGKAM